MNKKVLVFGHLPRAQGGRQQSGLANAMWAIAHGMSHSVGRPQIVFCATDVRGDDCRAIDGVVVKGWTARHLVHRIFRSPVVSAIAFIRLLTLCRTYELPFIRTFLKAIHLLESTATFKPDFIHLHTCEAVLYLKAGIVPEQKSFVTIHGIHGIDEHPRLVKMQLELGSLQIKFISFVSKATHDEWMSEVGMPKARAVVIANAFDRNRFFLERGCERERGGRKDIYHIFSIGSITENKGQERVVEAIGMAQLQKIHPKYVYTVIGGGTDEDVLKLLKNASETNVAVRYFPYLSPDEIREKLGEADFMLLPSIREGFGLVFLESIACGVPVVLPRNLPICSEPELISSENSVLIDGPEVSSITSFLETVHRYSFDSRRVASSLPEISWSAVGDSYVREL